MYYTHKQINKYLKFIAYTKERKENKKMATLIIVAENKFKYLNLNFHWPANHEGFFFFCL